MTMYKVLVMLIRRTSQECIEAITQNQEDTLRETHNDPNCELTESNCINKNFWCWS